MEIKGFFLSVSLLVFVFVFVFVFFLRSSNFLNGSYAICNMQYVDILIEISFTHAIIAKAMLIDKLLIFVTLLTFYSLKGLLNH